MTEREKMIDLIINANKSDPETGSFTEYLADFLLGYGIKLPDPTPQPGKPLTLDQLREMQGEKVILYRMKSTEPLETGTVKENGDVLGDAGMLAYHELYLETWVAFSVALAQQRWIPVSERLPDKGNDVLAYETSKYVGVERIAIDRLEEGEKHPIWMYTTGWFEVTHWMPLPEPPEEG